MCGRAYSTYTAEELYFQFLNKQPLRMEPLKPNLDAEASSDMRNAAVVFLSKPPLDSQAE
jgi:hypothetical protein